MHHRWLNCYGQTYARLASDQSVYNKPKPGHTILIKALAPLLWEAPEVHLRGLNEVFVDGIVSKTSWDAFFANLQKEWQEYVLYVRRQSVASKSSE